VAGRDFVCIYSKGVEVSMPATTRKACYFLKFIVLFGLVYGAVLFQGLVQGNLTKSQALEVDSVVRRYLDLQVRKIGLPVLY
jgi:hypothetical protein